MYSGKTKNAIKKSGARLYLSALRDESLNFTSKHIAFLKKDRGPGEEKTFFLVKKSFFFPRESPIPFGNGAFSREFDLDLGAA